jgi:hypothetical protein
MNGSRLNHFHHHASVLWRARVEIIIKIDKHVSALPRLPANLFRPRIQLDC